MDEDLNEIVTCNTCKTEFVGYGWESQQAPDCSAEVKGNTLEGFYGSTVADGDKYTFTEKPDNVNDGNICDKCITSLKKYLMLDQKYYNGVILDE